MTDEQGRPRVATPTDVSAAIERRRRQERRRQTRTLVLAVAGLVLALALVWLVRFSPVLAARQVEVTGASLVSAAQVEQAAAVPLGTPLVALDTTAVAERVAGLLPVESVRVHTRLPGTVQVEVSERQMVYQRRSGAGHQSVDAHGVIFATTAKPAAKAVQASTASVDNRLLADVATVVQALPPAVRSKVQLVRADGPDRIELDLDQGRRVVWGSAAASQEKGRVLQVLLGQKATVFDVSSPATPSTR